MKHFAQFVSTFLLLMSILFAPSGYAQSSVDFEITKESFFEEGLAPVRKSGPYDLTIVYFMDYQCPACRKYTPDVERVLKEDPRIRVIYRDTPLLGPRSDKAALAAIASSFQGRHEAFHHALMMTKGQLDDTAIKSAATKAGVNWSRLERDMVGRREDIDLLIARNFDLATDIGIAGTPAFIIGDRQSNGALDYRALKLEIADARKALGVKTPRSEEGEQEGSESNSATTSGSGAQRGPDAAVESAELPVSGENQVARPPDPNRSAERDGAWKWWALVVASLFVLAGFWAAAGRKSRDRVDGG